MYLYYKSLFQTSENAKDTSEVNIYSGMANLNDQNIEKFVSKGQHFVMFYVPWCKASQVIRIAILHLF